MRRELNIKTCSLTGTSDITIIAPIRKGLVPGLETVTYKSRARRVLRTLHASRLASHESELIRVLSDAIERVGRIHSVRVAVIEPGDQILLAVTFDGSFESYVRVIWQKVSRLLDLIFCNTEDYVTGWDHSFDDWARWFRQRQTQTSFFYSAPGVSAPDQIYLRMQESLQRRSANDDLEIGRVRVPGAERIATELIEQAVDLTNPFHGKAGDLRKVVGPAAIRQGLRGVVGLYRLADVFPPSSADGVLLHRAARELLPEFLVMTGDTAFQLAINERKDRFGEALNWFESESELEPLPSVREAAIVEGTPNQLDPRDVQGGVIEPYKNVTHGALLLVSFDNRAAVGQFLTALNVTAGVGSDTGGEDAIAWNVAFTVAGLRLAGLTEDEIAWFPEDFRQGMPARAGLLGDLRTNHPRRWRLPAANWAYGAKAKDVGEHDEAARIELESVHAVLQVRTGRSLTTNPPERDRLYAALEGLIKKSSGLQPLSIQWMQRTFETQEKSLEGTPKRVVEHFGFTDGESQPEFFDKGIGLRYDNSAMLGEVLLGHPNQADKVCPYTNPTGRTEEEARRRTALFQNSSFLVVRKLRQDVGVLQRVLKAAQGSGIKPELAPAKMMGRWRARAGAEAGQPLAAAAKGSLNDFAFDDADGSVCPLHAHIRRANPRIPVDPNAPAGARPPRLIRRSMPYGPAPITDVDGTVEQESLNQERGLIFMTFNASIGEQFEVVQRWLAGGNSAGGFSGHSDPFCGLAEPGKKRFFAFEEAGVRHRIELDGSDVIGEETDPLVRLEWGSYFFAPSVTSLRWLKARAEAPIETKAEVEWRADVGERQIEKLRELEKYQGSSVAALAWKAALEDPEAVASHVSASIWAAIRENHGGAIRTPYGVLVASKTQVDAALCDPLRRYTVAGYLDRMRRSIGEIYLGLDDDPANGEYQRQSAACNAAIQAIPFANARELAFLATERAINAFVQKEKDLAAELNGPNSTSATHWELTLDIRELVDVVLADLSEEWFGLKDGGAFRRGGFRWDWKPGSAPYYPGHFTAPSRSFFQPLPGADVERLGQAHGQALTKAMFSAITGKTEINAAAPITAAVLKSAPRRSDLNLAARTLVGALMGFLPTTDGNLRRIFNEWMRDGTLWQLRAAAPGGVWSDPKFQAKLTAPIRNAMQLRPVPELIWRSAALAHHLELDDGSSVAIAQGDQVVLALVSATQEAYEQRTESSPGEPDVHAIFGGVRAPGGPTHACPAYDAAMGVLFGFFSALVASIQTMRPGPSSTSLFFEGVTQPARPTQSALKGLGAQAWQGQAIAFKASLAPKTIAKTLKAMAIGDSWLFDWPKLFWPSLFAELSAHGYELSPNKCKVGLRLAEFFLPSGKPLIDTVCRNYEIALQSANPPAVVFISAGGNDVTYLPNGKPAQVLCTLLNVKSSSVGVVNAINQAELTSFLKGLEENYTRLFTRLLDVGKSVPLVIHGYDHPLPELGQKLSKCIQANGWTLAEGRTIMAALIDQLNTTISGSAGKFPGRVHHVNLCGKLQKFAYDNFGGDVLQLWKDDLHPSDQGFGILAAEICAVLPAKIVPK
jgi:deferrochelatase/peroxidase EfeB